MSRPGQLFVVLLVACPLQMQAESPAGSVGTLGRDILNIYEAAVVHMEKICDDYRRIKSIQLARLRDLAFPEAYENISSVMPVLGVKNDQALKNLLRKAIRDPRDIQKHKQAVEQVKKEIEMMIDLTAKLLKEIEVVQQELAHGNEAYELTLEEIVQQPEYDPEAELETPAEVEATETEFQELAKLAREDESQPAKDLTPVMRQFYPDVKDLTREEEETAEPPSLPVFKSSNDVGKLRTIVLDDVHKVFGRKIKAGGTPAEWMFVNSWHTIGPFANPQRQNIHRKFPPETVIDLNARYLGKGGKEVRWKFIESAKEMMTPADPEEYAIYYAYTEVHCDRPMDLWVAVGSDDKANVWLNGMPIWISSDKLKGWKVNEGFRKVSFRKGVNSVLYRVENGWHDVGFSFGIRVAE
jgi:hypothetical protein